MKESKSTALLHNQIKPVTHVKMNQH